MLQELRILDLGVIDEAVIEPHPGLTVVTGETGAGKTMVVTALGLICGGRGQAGKVRAGRQRAGVEIRWVPSADGAADPTGCESGADAALASLVESAGGRFDEDGALIAARTLGADGRSRAHVGGRSVPLSVLTELAEPLIAVHGQSEAISLLRPGPQRAVLDRFAGLTADVEATAICDPVGSDWRRSWPTRAAGPGSAPNGSSCCGWGWPRSRPSIPSPARIVS
jgi:DNA repair protein RecN (Recombination protein N)